MRAGREPRRAPMLRTSPSPPQGRGRKTGQVGDVMARLSCTLATSQGEEKIVRTLPTSPRGGRKQSELVVWAGGLLIQSMAATSETFV